MIYRENVRPQPPPPPDLSGLDDYADQLEATARRRATVRYVVSVFFIGLACIVAAGVVIALFVSLELQREECVQKGGTWFPTEHKCFAVKEIR
jgi:hypothetical protein